MSLEEGDRNKFEQIDEYNEAMNQQREDKAGRSSYFQDDTPFAMRDKITRVEKAVLHVNDILKPYWANAAHKSTKAAIGEKMQAKSQPWVDRLNGCMNRANDMTDSNFCMDQMIESLEGDMVDWAKKYAKSL